MNRKNEYSLLFLVVVVEMQGELHQMLAAYSFVQGGNFASYLSCADEVVNVLMQY